MKNIALIIAILLLSMSTIGCSDFKQRPVDSVSVASVSETSTEAAKEAADSQDVIVAVDGSIDPTNATIDPVYEDSEIVSLFPTVFEGLVKIERSETVDVVPLLAESWTCEANTIYSFKLKTGTKFNDGSDVTIEDWIWSFERLKNAADSPWASYAGIIESVTSSSADMLTIKLRQPYADFETILALPAFSVQSKKHAESVGDEKYSKQPMGTGPFYFDSYEIGKSYHLKRNLNYRDETSSNVDSVVFKIVNDESLRIKQLEAGELDVCISPPNNRVAELRADSRFAVVSVPKLTQRYVVLNVTKPPLDNVKVRRALRMATEKKEIIDMLLFKNANIAFNVFPSGVLYLDPSMADEESFDLDKAQALLTEAGFPNGFDTEISYVLSDGVTTGIASLLKEQWAKIGVNVKLNALSSEDWNKQLDSMEHTITTLCWAEETANPSALSTYLSDYNISHGFQSGYQNPKLLQLAADAAASTDAEKRAEIYKEIQRLLYDECPIFPIYSDTFVVAKTKEVIGFNVLPFGYYSLDKLQKK